MEISVSALSVFKNLSYSGSAKWSKNESSPLHGVVHFLIASTSEVPHENCKRLVISPYSEDDLNQNHLIKMPWIYSQSLDERTLCLEFAQLLKSKGFEIWLLFKIKWRICQNLWIIFQRPAVTVLKNRRSKRRQSDLPLTGIPLPGNFSPIFFPYIPCLSEKQNAFPVFLSAFIIGKTTNMIKQKKSCKMLFIQKTEAKMFET